MPTFHYQALSTKGERIAGVLGGASEQAVLAELESRSLTPVSIQPAREPLMARRPVSARQLGITYQQLSDLLRAGVPLLRSIKLLGGRRSNPRLAAVFRELAEAVSEGEDLGEAMTRHPRVFPKVHVAMVRAGERGGFLESVLARLGQFVQAQADLRGKVVGNLVYPCALVVVGTAILSVIFGVFVPMFEPIFGRLEGNLPLVSRLVFGMSELVATYAPLTLLAIGLVTFSLWRLSKRPNVRRRITVVLTRMPVLGPLNRALAAARFCRLLGTMLSNGVPMLTAMQIAREASGNVLMEEAIDQAVEAVRAGESLAPPLAQSGLFGDDVVEMISVGESANNLDSVLIGVAETIESRIDRLLSGAVRLIEPLLLLLIAGVVVVVAAGLLLPMVELSSGW